VALTYLKVKSAKCLCLPPVVLVLLFWYWSWSCKQRSWSKEIGLVYIIANYRTCLMYLNVKCRRWYRFVHRTPSGPRNRNCSVRQLWRYAERL